MRTPNLLLVVLLAGLPTTIYAPTTTPTRQPPPSRSIPSRKAASVEVVPRISKDPFFPRYDVSALTANTHEAYVLFRQPELGIHTFSRFVTGGASPSSQEQQMLLLTVSEVQKSGEGAHHRVHVGDRIEAIDGTSVSDMEPEQAKGLLKTVRPLRIKFSRTVVTWSPSCRTG